LHGLNLRELCCGKTLPAKESVKYNGTAKYDGQRFGMSLPAAPEPGWQAHPVSKKPGQTGKYRKLDEYVYLG
jgi:hypothetical protein